MSDVAKTLEEATVAELLTEATKRATAKRTESFGEHPDAAREFAETVTQLEYAQMRYTRGMAMTLGVFAPVDLEDADAIEERLQFLHSAQDAQS